MTRHKSADLIEDAEWLIRDGATLTEALRRLDIKSDAFWKACARAGRLDLFDQLADREPDGPHRRATREAVRARKPALLRGSEHFDTVDFEKKRGPESLAGDRPSNHLSLAKNERG